MYLHINPHDEAPVYRQIQRQIARAITEREIHPGEPLLAQQDLAAQLTVSPAAVGKAYCELQADGLCQQSPGNRYRVTTPDLRATDGSRTDLALSLLQREFLTQELRTARDVQLRLLPPPEVRGSSWTVSSRCYPAGALAGDFYEVIQPDPHIVDVVAADVAGKGLAAGMIMATTKSLIPMAATLDSPAAALGLINEKLCPLLNCREFVALAYARLDTLTGVLQLANAGLPDPYLLRHTGTVDTLVVGGERFPLGIRSGISYSTARFSVKDADRLLLVTDGIPEAADATGRPIGYEGLAELLDASADWAWDAATGRSSLWLDRLLEQVSHRTGSILDDDWTAVLLEYHLSRGNTPCNS